MHMYKIAVIPGDGIGKEVMIEALKILETISSQSTKVGFFVDVYDWGCGYYLKHGKMMPDDGIDKLKNYDAILLGAVGSPEVPEHISVRGLVINIRQEFNQYINLRPIKLLKNVDCPLKNKGPEDIDMIFIRENVEGEYSGVGGLIKEGTPEETAIQTSVFTRKNIEKLMEYAFKFAEKRNEKKITSITKSNALNYSMVFWDKVFNEKAKKFSDIKTESILVDAAAMFMVKNPEKFDVIVGSNLFGDILTDLGAAIQGGMGFAAGGNINPENDFPSMFEPIHGSGPDIAGKGLANPTAMIWAVALMLEHLKLNGLANKLIQSIEESVLDKNKLTPDQGGKGSTSDVGSLITDLFRKKGIE